jgi:osmotically-inducible protein OsmY
VDDARIEVKVIRGDVILSGAVGSLVEKERAFRDAWVAGVMSVEDDALRVERPLMGDDMRRRIAYGVRSDEEIAKAINTSFSYDPRVSPSRIIVTVDNGIVTLAGKVDSFKARRIAGEDAQNTVGVWMVKNHLTVVPDLIPETHPKPHRDVELAKRVRLALLRNPYTHQHEIGVNVNNHRVMLDGTVRSRLMKAKAEDVVSGVKGVVVVINNIKIKRKWNPKEDSEIKTDIENELWWSVFVDEDDIAVSVKKGVATLMGVVDTLRERRVAPENAKEGGAKDVRNRLKVRYGPESLRP